MLSPQAHRTIEEGKPLPQPHILHAIRKFFHKYRETNRYDNISLFALAQVMSYGMHRKFCWEETKNNQSIQFFKIDEAKILSQANFVHDSVMTFHDELYGVAKKNLTQSNQDDCDVLMCDLFDKLAAVVLIKSSINTFIHEKKRIKQLSEIVTSFEERKACLDMVYRYETSDQKQVFKALLDQYIINSNSRLIVRCHCISLMHGVSFKCDDLLRFFSCRSDQLQWRPWGSTSMADFLQSDPEPEVSEFRLSHSSASVTDLSLFKSENDIIVNDKQANTARAHSPSYDPVFDNNEWSYLSHQIETLRSQMTNTAA